MMKDLENIDDYEEEDFGGTNERVDSSTNSLSRQAEEERDEVQEILKLSEKHTWWMRRVRAVVFLLLLLTGVAVTVTTYILLRNKEKQDFQRAVSWVGKECFGLLELCRLLTVLDVTRTFTV